MNPKYYINLRRIEGFLLSKKFSKRISGYDFQNIFKYYKKSPVIRSKYQKNSFENIYVPKSGSMAKSTEGKYIRCTIFDQEGNITVHGKDIDKQDFMKAYNLSQRDTRRLSRHRHGTLNLGLNQNINVDFVPSFLMRRDFILLHLLNVKALIKSDTVVIFDSLNTGGGGLNESQTHESFLSDMSRRLKEKSDYLIPYEFKALECILIRVTLNLTTEMNVHKNVLQAILQNLEKSIERSQLRYLLIESKKLSSFHQKAVLMRDLLSDILEDDDELNDLFLTKKSKGIPVTDHTEAELILESYYTTNDEIVQTVENLMSQIKTTEEIINVVLDSNRNELMLLGLRFSLGLLSFGLVLYLSSLFGMNLENFIEETDEGFTAVIAISIVSFFVLLGFTVARLKRLQRITMMGISRKKDIRLGS